MAQGNGRDHHIKGFSMWMAGGGSKAGHHYGATDELGYNAVEDVVEVHDFHATMLRLMGVDHLKLTYRTKGRGYRLTDIHRRGIDEVRLRGEERYPKPLRGLHLPQRLGRSHLSRTTRRSGEQDGYNRDRRNQGGFEGDSHAHHPPEGLNIHDSNADYRELPE